MIQFIKNLDGEILSALVAIIGLIVLWIKDHKNSKKITDLQILNSSLSSKFDLSNEKLLDIMREIGIGNEIGARNVHAKKYELDEIRKHIKIIEESNKFNTERTEALFIQSIYNNFREVFTLIMNSKETIDILSEELKINNKDLIKRYFSSFLINNAYQCYLLNEKRLLPENLWDRIEIDMKELFSWNFILVRWNSISKLYPENFNLYIGTLIN